jgi:GMP synthase (glutamine-hydrolysing)
MSVGIIDFGGQYTHLIARRCRGLGYRSVVVPFFSNIDDEIEKENIRALIISGGPRSVDEEEMFARVAIKVVEKAKRGIPVLGICFGHQLIAYVMGGRVEKRVKSEFGETKVNVMTNDTLFDGVPSVFTAWMSHNDTVTSLPEDLVVLAISENNAIAAFRHRELPIYGVQFHPEVAHTEHGLNILSNFLSKVAGLTPTWNPTSAIDEIINEIRAKYPTGNALVAVSGGVDSITTAVVMLKALGPDRVHVLFIDTGLMREGEADFVRNALAEIGFKNIHIVDASQRFIRALKGVSDPEEKRRVIAEKFKEVFEEAIENLEKNYGKFIVFGQGTIYPDRIESGKAGAGSTKIKSHHNVVMESLRGVAMVEPLAEFYKDEVRVIATHLGVPSRIVNRHPFPGPGLAVRILGEIDEDKLRIIKKATQIVEKILVEEGLYDKLWQAFPVLLPVKSVGVKGDSRAYGYIISLRAVESVDAMTASFAKLPWELLSKIASRIVSEIPEVVRVVYDVTNKPPATIEYE